MEPSFSPVDPLSPKPWYKTKTGLVIISMISLIIIAGLLFAGFVASYAIKIRNGQDVAPQAISGFSKDNLLAAKQKKPITAGDILATIQPFNASKGPENAPVIIVAFLDFECPYCKQSAPVFEEITEKYGASAKVIIKHFPLVSIHPNAAEAAIGATCAQEQGRFWDYYATLFSQDELTNETPKQAAEALDMDIAAFTACMKKRLHIDEIEQDIKDGVALGVQGTPTYFVNAKKIEGVPSKEQWDTFIQDALQ